MILKINSEYFPTQHQTAGCCQVYAMDIHCLLWGHTKFLNIILMNVRLQRAVCLIEWLIEKTRQQMYVQIEYLRSYKDQYTKKNFSQKKHNCLK
jgi:hypothetical protein